MTDIAIKIDKLSKCYRIYDQPQDRLKEMVMPRLQRLAGRQPGQYSREFWALKDVSLEVKKGEIIGIIGRNGSGKSTLLQMICGTLNPTSGTIITQGRIAALLELGSGFNPEFTGRENVYLNASVLGLSRSETHEQFDSIESFADIGDFIDQPVKTYSSGMMLRLAFAVSVHVQPDILIVDEALSVGDIAFRNKCMEVIQKLVSRGVTILFVTHDLGTLQLLCSRVIWLAKGELKASGNPIRVAQDYYASTMEGGKIDPKTSSSLPTQQETGKAKFTELALLGGEDGVFTTGHPLRLGFVMHAMQELPELVFAISIYRADGDWLVGQTSRDEDVFMNAPKAGQDCSGYLNLQSLCLTPGEYVIAFAAYSKDYSFCYAMTDVGLPFSVRTPYPTWGKFYHPCVWSFEEN